MFYLSAQPDAAYFKWQLEVQLYNFQELGIPFDKIHVLIGYNSTTGLSPKFQEFAKEQKDKALFFFYEDNRAEKNYASSIRPHIIKKHFLTCPFLQEECIFYHDADIIFRQLPDFTALCAGDKWFVSDTHTYIGPDFIHTAGEIIFMEMCELLRVDRELILRNKDNTGGAQYVLKGVNYQFWEKVEKDSEKLFTYLNQNASRYADMFSKNSCNHDRQYPGIQAWCADMWAVLWNGFNLGYQIEISEELDFCWPAEPIAKWDATKIMHNAGITESTSATHFYKGGFYNNAPYDSTFVHVARDRCTIKYVEAIEKYMASKRTDFSDVSFLISARIDSNDRLENIYTVTHFLNKYFITKILLVEADSESMIDGCKLPECVERIFIEDKNIFLHRAKYHNLMAKRANTAIICLHDTDTLCDPGQMVKAVDKIRSKAYSVAFPYDGRVISVEESDLKSFFSTKLDIRMLESCADVINTRSYGGAVFLFRQAFMKSGMDNENIYKWGPQDTERIKRLEILGFTCARIEGPLYHLSHKRAHNSRFTDSADYETLMNELLRISKMSTKELENEIGNWSWNNTQLVTC